MATQISSSFPSRTWPADLRVTLDNACFSSGSPVRFRVSHDAVEGESAEAFDFYSSIFRAGERTPVQPSTLIKSKAGARESGYRTAWSIPSEAETGSYTLFLHARQRVSGATVWRSGPIPFAVWRRDISITGFDADRRFYTPGDPIVFELTVRNHTHQRWTGLQIELGEGQYPWIESDGTQAPQLLPAFDLAPGESRRITATGTIRSDAATGTVHYTATVRRTARRGEVTAFRSTSAIFVRNADRASEPVYPFSYLHANLGAIRVDGYRSFYSGSTTDSSLQLSRTSFAAHQRNSFEILASSAPSWEHGTLELRRLSGELIDTAQLQPDAAAFKIELTFPEPGLYQLTANLKPSNGTLHPAATWEVSANVLPRALAIICPHPDDEFLHPAAIRAAVENGVPVHLIYLTLGDAGGSDRFFGAGYSPAEAIEFGYVRMAEARAATRHLGVPESNLHFLGLPDGFLETIRIKGNGLQPVFSPLLGTDHAPYRELAAANLPFEKESVLDVLVDLLADIDPDTVYVSHPDERHNDHRAGGRFTTEALRRLLAEGRLSSVPKVFVDQYYGASAHSGAPYQYREHRFFASGESMARVQEAYWFYQSQGGNHARGHVLGLADLPRVESHREIVNWAVVPVDAKIPVLAAAG